MYSEIGQTGEGGKGTGNDRFPLRQKAYGWLMVVAHYRQDLEQVKEDRIFPLELTS